MRKIGLLITLLFVVCKGFAQQDCVVLIDADKYQPFYARIGDRTYPSSAAGHLTISHLKDSTYQVHIGFPQGGIPENRFLIRVNKKDQGFQLRYLNEKGWALYNWQTSELKMPMDRDTKQASMLLDNGVKRDDAFSRLMAGVVNDTAVLYNTYVEEATPRDSSKNLVLQAVAVPAAKQEKNQKTAEPMQQEKTQKTAEPAKMPTVLKIKEQTLISALRLVYVVYPKKGNPDTIIIFIPFEKGTESGMMIKGQPEKKGWGMMPQAMNAAVLLLVNGDMRKEDAIARSGLCLLTGPLSRKYRKTVIRRIIKV